MLERLISLDSLPELGRFAPSRKSLRGRDFSPDRATVGLIIVPGALVVPESFERESGENYNGPVNAEGKAVYGKRNANSVIEARQRRLYKHQQSGLTARALVATGKP